MRTSRANPLPFSVVLLLSEPDEPTPRFTFCGVVLLLLFLIPFADTTDGRENGGLCVFRVGASQALFLVGIYSRLRW